MKYRIVKKTNGLGQSSYFVDVKKGFLWFGKWKPLKGPRVIQLEPRFSGGEFVKVAYKLREASGMHNIGNFIVKLFHKIEMYSSEEEAREMIEFAKNFYNNKFFVLPSFGQNVYILTKSMIKHGSYVYAIGGTDLKVLEEHIALEESINKIVTEFIGE